MWRLCAALYRLYKKKSTGPLAQMDHESETEAGKNKIKGERAKHDGTGSVPCETEFCRSVSKCFHTVAANSYVYQRI